MIDTTEQRGKRAKLLARCREISEQAETEKRDMTAEERENYDKAWDAQCTTDREIENAERRNNLERAEAELELSQREEKREEHRKLPERKTEQTTTATSHPYSSTEYRSGFAKWLVSGDRRLDVEELRALSTGKGTEGGYLYASDQFVADLIQNVTDATIIRQLARTYQISSADAIMAPKLTNRMAAAVWTSELGAPSTDSTLDFGGMRLTPHPLAKEILVSKPLLRKVPDAESIVRGELARVVAEANENAFLTGTGAEQPLGVFTASSDGISTSRDVSSGNTITSIKFDNLKEIEFTLKQQYHASARWLMHRDVAKQLAKLKDGDGQYIWQRNVTMGEQNMLMGYPVILSEFAPNTLTTGKYVAILGDFSNYWIVDALDAQIARAEELYIRQNQDLFVIRMETGGGPVREEAFVRSKLA